MNEIDIDDELPTREEIYEMLDKKVFWLYNDIHPIPSPWYLWVMEKAPEVIDDFDNFAKKYISSQYDEYCRLFGDKKK